MTATNVTHMPETHKPEPPSQPARTHTTADLARQMVGHVYPGATVKGDLLILPISTPHGWRTVEVDCTSSGAYLFDVSDPGLWAAYRALLNTPADPDTLLSEHDVSASDEIECFHADCERQADIGPTIAKLLAALTSIVWCAETLTPATPKAAFERTPTEREIEKALEAILTPEYLDDAIESATDRGEDDHGRKRESFDAKWLARHMHEYLAQEIAAKLEAEPDEPAAAPQTEQQTQLRRLAEGLSRTVLATARHYHYGGAGMGVAYDGQPRDVKRLLDQLGEEAVQATRDDRRQQAVTAAKHDLEDTLRLAERAALSVDEDASFALAVGQALRRMRESIERMDPASSMIETYRRTLRGAK